MEYISIILNTKNVFFKEQETFCQNEKSYNKIDFYSKSKIYKSDLCMRSNFTQRRKIN